MSVYKPAKSRFWQFDFVLRGRRFHGSTGQETRRAAEAAERRLRLEAAEGRLGEASTLTLDQAAGKWWAEVGSRRADCDDVERRVAALLAIMGPATILADIDTPAISTAIQKRRAITYRRGGKESQKRLPSNATVNRDVIETLRPILRRAATHWGAKGLPAIAWRDLKLAEPAPPVRVYSAAEQAAWLAECGPAPALALRMLLTYGLRYGELFFELDAFDAEGRRLAVRKRKRDVPLILPLRQDDAREIAARVGRAQAAGLDHIWFAETPAKGRAKAKLAPLTYHGLKARLAGAAARAGIAPGRLIHGTRHHAGSTATRRGSLRLAQELLGHADIKSTLRYAHVLEADLRALVDDVPRNSPEPPNPEGEKTIRNKA